MFVKLHINNIKACSVRQWVRVLPVRVRVCVCVCVCVWSAHTHTHTHTCSRHTTGMVDGAHAHRTQTADRGEEKRREEKRREEKRREEKRREEKRREEKRREEKRREEGLKFSISGYRLQQCLMQKKKNITQKCPVVYFPRYDGRPFPRRDGLWEITEQSPAEGKLQNVFLKAWNPFFYARADSCFL